MGQPVDNHNLLGIDRVGDVLAFVRVADAQSFTVAAQRLGLTRSAIGKCIARLEDCLGTRLVHRTTRRVSLTDEGRLFYEHAVCILSEVDSATAALASRNEAPRGRLRIDLPVAFGRKHVLPVLQRFLERWPDVEAEVTFTDDYTDLVREGIDLAIRIGGDYDSRLVQRVLTAHHLVTCATPDYLARHGVPQTPDDLVHHKTLVFMHNGMPVPWRYEVNGKMRNVPVSGRLRLGNTEALRDAALSGVGMVQLSTFLIGTDLHDGRLVPVLENFTLPSIPVHAVYPHRRYLAPKVRSFIDAILEEWRDPPPWSSCAVLNLTAHAG